MKSQIKTILFTIAVLIISLFIPLQLLAIGQITKPIVIDNALKGQVIEENMYLFNTEDNDTAFDLSAEGDIADWTSFYNPDDLDTPVKNISIPANIKFTLIARFTVPNDTPNGEYTGSVNIISGAVEEESEDAISTSVRRKIARSVSIKVTDIEKVDLKATIIPGTYDSDSGEMLKMRIIYFNNGNIVVKPQVQLKINKQDSTVYNAIYPYPEDLEGVRPLATQEIPVIELSLNGFEHGRYVGVADILYQGEIVKEESFGFSVGMEGKRISGTFISSALFKVIGAIAIIIALAILIYFKSGKEEKNKRNKRNKINKINKNRINKKSKISVTNRILLFFNHLKELIVGGTGKVQRKANKKVNKKNNLLTLVSKIKTYFFA